MPDRIKLAEDRHALIDTLDEVSGLIQWDRCGSEEGFSWARCHIGEDRNGHFVSLSQEEPAKVSYATKIDFRFDNQRRTKTTIGRYLKRNFQQFGENVTDREMRQIVEEWTKIISIRTGDLDDKIKIVYGDAVQEAYEQRVGCGSCMTGGDSELVRLYAMNPDKVGILIFGEDRARALVWKTEEGDVVLDRIYPNSGYHVGLIQRWCKQNDIVLRVGQGYPEEELISFENEKVYTVDLNVEWLEVFPYMDTFCYGKFIFNDHKRKKKLILTNWQDPDNRFHTFLSTGGGFSGGCGNCGEVPARHYPGNGYYCDSCRDAYLRECPRCNDLHNTCNFYRVTDVGEEWCVRCIERETRHCRECHTRFLDGSNVIRFRDTGNRYCLDCIIRYARDPEHCTICGNWYEYGTNYGLNPNGNVVCNSCATPCIECDEMTPRVRDTYGRVRREYTRCDSCMGAIYSETTLEV